MGVEIERKFLVIGDAWRQAVVKSSHISQGYLARTDRMEIRVRLKDDKGYLTIKGQRHGSVRTEYEVEFPTADIREILNQLVDGVVLEKERHLVPVGDLTFEIDEFIGDNAPLVLAEVELPSASHEVPTTLWLGTEVTEDHRFYNSYLSKVPFGSWPAESSTG